MAGDNMKILLFIPKLIFITIVCMYIYLILPIISILINLIMFPFARLKASQREYKLFQDATCYKKDYEKFRFMQERYQWVSDPFYGVLNYNWYFLWVAVWLDYKKDCDGYAFLMKRLIPGGKIYTIIPYNPKNWHRAHVVYKYGNTVFESGRWHRKNLDDYLNWAYTLEDVDYLLLRTF